MIALFGGGWVRQQERAGNTTRGPDLGQEARKKWAQQKSIMIMDMDMGNTGGLGLVAAQRWRSAAP